MNNSQVRAHLRKGEQAVNTLEALGYTYDGVRWVAPPAKPEDALLAPIIKALADAAAIKETQRDETIRSGDRFIITTLPPALVAVHTAWPDWRNRVFKAGCVNDHSREQGRKVIRFGHNAVASAGLWIDVKFCQKVHDDDRF